MTEASELLHLPGRKIGLVEIARTIGCSPFHLSRVFHEITGSTIPQYRNRLRTYEALRRLSDGEHDLAAIAAVERLRRSQPHDAFHRRPLRRPTVTIA